MLFIKPLLVAAVIRFRIPIDLFRLYKILLSLKAGANLMIVIGLFTLSLNFFIKN